MIFLKAKPRKAAHHARRSRRPPLSRLPPAARRPPFVLLCYRVTMASVPDYENAAAPAAAVDSWYLEALGVAIRGFLHVARTHTEYEHRRWRDMNEYYTGPMSPMELTAFEDMSELVDRRMVAAQTIVDALKESPRPHSKDTTRLVAQLEPTAFVTDKIAKIIAFFKKVFISRCKDDGYDYNPTIVYPTDNDFDETVEMRAFIVPYSKHPNLLSELKKRFVSCGNSAVKCFQLSAEREAELHREEYGSESSESSTHHCVSDCSSCHGWDSEVRDAKRRRRN